MKMKILTVGLAAALLAACSPAPPPPAQETPVEAPAETVTELHIGATDTSSFKLQPDGSWVELGPEGQARFRFSHERADGQAFIVFDETRNVRLRLDPIANTITEEIPDGWRPLYAIATVVRNAPPADVPIASRSAATAKRIWFEGGGAFVSTGKAWSEISREDGMNHGGHWLEASRDADTIELRDDGRGARARIELSEGAVYLFFPDWGEWRRQWGIRAIDHW